MAMIKTVAVILSVKERKTLGCEFFTLIMVNTTLEPQM